MKLTYSAVSIADGHFLSTVGGAAPTTMGSRSRPSCLPWTKPGFRQSPWRTHRRIGSTSMLPQTAIHGRGSSIELPSRSVRILRPAFPRTGPDGLHRRSRCRGAAEGGGPCPRGSPTAPFPPAARLPLP
jgi:hypothetical protein